MASLSKLSRISVLVVAAASACMADNSLGGDIIRGAHPDAVSGSGGTSVAVGSGGSMGSGGSPVMTGSGGDSMGGVVGTGGAGPGSGGAGATTATGGGAGSRPPSGGT